MFLDDWDVGLEISVVSTHVNLNGLSVHVIKQENGKSVSTLVLFDSPQKINGENVRKKKYKT